MPKTLTKKQMIEIMDLGYWGPLLPHFKARVTRMKKAELTDEFNAHVENSVHNMTAALAAEGEQFTHDYLQGFVRSFGSIVACWPSGCAEWWKAHPGRHRIKARCLAAIAFGEVFRSIAHIADMAADDAADLSHPACRTCTIKDPACDNCEAVHGSDCNGIYM